MEQTGTYLVDSRQARAKAALQVWARQNGIGVSEFAARLGYGYQYGWNLLRGSQAVTDNVIGRMAREWPQQAIVLADILNGEVGAQGE